MKQNIITIGKYLLAALPVLLLAACSEEDAPVTDSASLAVTFTAGIGEATPAPSAATMPQTRAATTGGNSWVKGEAVSIFMVDHSTQDIVDGAENQQYIASADGVNVSFSPATPDDVIFYPQDNARVDFIACSYVTRLPFTGSILINLGYKQTADNQAQIDVLWAKADKGGAGYSKAEKADVAFTFGHCLSKLTMNCTLDASVGAANLDGAKVTIHGMNTVSTFDLKTGKQNGIPESPADITPRKLAIPTANFDATYDAIILPTGYSAGAVTVDFEINSEIYTWNVDAMTFEAGNEYIYEVKITHTDVNFTGTIVGWNPVTHQGPVYAE